MGQFFLMGVVTASFLSRVPSVTETLHVTTGRFAVLMLTGALGAFVALMVTGWAVARVGTRVVMWASLIGYAVFFGVATLGLALGSQWIFAIAQFFISFSFAFTNVSINAEAAAVERAVGRAILPHFHASFSVGMAVGLGVGALVSHAGVGPVMHFAVMTVVALAVRLALVGPSIMDGKPTGTSHVGWGGPFRTAKAEFRERRIILLGLILFAASTIEGAAATWSSLAVVQAFEAPEAVGDLFFWVFLVAMVTSRGLGSQIIGRLGRVVSLRVSAVMVVLGVVLFAFGPSFPWVGAGMVLWGLGAGLAVPIGFSAAADDPRRAAARVAAVTSFSTIAGLVMPQVIGHLGDVVELRQALLVACAAAVLSFMLARAVRKDGPLLRSHRAIARRAAREQETAPHL